MHFGKGIGGVLRKRKTILFQNKFKYFLVFIDKFCFTL